MKGEALAFFRDNICGKLTKCDEIVRVMNTECIPQWPQDMMYSKLIDITMEDFMTEGRTESEARKE